MKKERILKVVFRIGFYSSLSTFIFLVLTGIILLFPDSVVDDPNLIYYHLMSIFRVLFFLSLVVFALSVVVIALLTAKGKPGFFFSDSDKEDDDS